MKQQLFEFFDRQPDLEKLTGITIRHIDALYFSAQQIFAVASYAAQSLLENHWERAAYQFAYRVQNQIPGELDDLRWDMYLVLFVDTQEVSNALKKRIESNRFFFRKIIITRSDLDRLSEKLPLGFQTALPEHQLERLWFHDRHFLQQWQSCVQETTNQRLNQALFQGGADSVDKLLSSLNIPVLAEVLDHED
ncbi:ABC-three component system middle component 1 [Bacillus sp. FJAT-28004]|uniref:ABC-three component system middle component 1 n=1 Tax=Bacillus sp. FJAT-28004 TaxID=1679165 RepID=UPI0006B467EB|nr:ABC-three component system middle component 1 [Bacillus sp. FJAT-28004]